MHNGMKEPCLVARGGKGKAADAMVKTGMKALADYVHSVGLRFGLYSDAGRQTCAGRPASRGYEFQDARQHPMDYLKYDWCSTTGQQTQESYMLMRDALKLAGRPIVFSLCEWGNSQPRTWAAKVADHHRHRGPVGRQAAQERRHCRGDTEPRSCRAGRHPGLGRSRRPAGEDLRRPGPMGAQGTGSDER